MLDGQSGLLAWLDLSEERSALRAQIDEQRLANEALADQIEALQNDPYESDRAIREALDFARPGETVVRFKQRNPLQEPSPSQAAPD